MRISNIKEKNTNKNIFKNIVGAFFVKGIALFLSLFSMPLFIKYFNDQTILGIWFAIVSIINWVAIFDLGLGNGLRNILPEILLENDKVKIKKAISTTYISMFVFVVFLGIVGVNIIRNLPWNYLLNISEGIISQEVLVTCLLIIFVGVLLRLIIGLIVSVLYALQLAAVVNFISVLSTFLVLLSIYIVPSTTISENLLKMSVINVLATTLPYAVITVILFKKNENVKKCWPSLTYFDNNLIKPIFKIGISLLFLQIIFMIISSTNEFLISFLASPDAVVEYQIYSKIFGTISSLFTLMLVPIWSGVTREKAKGNYLWIIKAYKLFLILPFATIIVSLCFLPFTQTFVNFWLKDNSIEISRIVCYVVIISNAIFVLHNVNTSFGNGISYFKLQMIWMVFAAIINIPLAFVLVKSTGSWCGVILSNIISLLPYNLLAPYFTLKNLKKMPLS